MTQDQASDQPAGGPAPAEEREVTVTVEFADRLCPRCRTRFVASYYRDGEYVKSRCLDCMLFWPTPLMA